MLTGGFFLSIGLLVGVLLLGALFWSSRGKVAWVGPVTLRIDTSRSASKKAWAAREVAHMTEEVAKMEQREKEERRKRMRQGAELALGGEGGSGA